MSTLTAKSTPLDVGTQSAAHDDARLTTPTPTLVHPQHRRGRFGWSDRLGLYLPKYDGQYRVGTTTLELPVPSNAALAPHGQTMQVTLFYPANLEHDHKAATRRTRWLGRSPYAVLQGYAKYFKLGRFTRAITLPIARLLFGGVQLPTYSQAPFAQPLDGEPRRKLVVWSHGLSGTKTLYSQYCGQLASRGYVVASLAHRDGSAPFTVSNFPDGTCHNQPFVTLHDLPRESRPDDILEMRGRQLATRTAELLAASTLLETFAADKGWKTFKERNLYVKGAKGWEGDDASAWSDGDWHALASGVSWSSDVVVAGHSFGAATVIASMRHPDRPHHWTSAILLDPWLEPLSHWPRDSPPLQPQITLPSLVINSPGFTVWRGHFPELVRIVKSGSGADQSWLCTVSDIMHTTFSDIPIMIEGSLNFLNKNKLSPQRAMEIFVGASLQFIGDKQADRFLSGPAEPGSETTVKTAPAGTISVHVAPRVH